MMADGMEKAMPGAAAGGCPLAHGSDERKTAALAARRVTPETGARVVTDFKFAREILRNPGMRQAGAGAKYVDLSKPETVSFFFLDGELHRKKRSQVARYFAQKAIDTRYQPVMDRVMDRLIADMKRDGQARLDLMSFQLAVEVAAEVVGLTETHPDKLALRIRRSFDAMSTHSDGPISRRVNKLKQMVHVMNFFYRDVKPAIRARKAHPGDDVISNLVKENYPDQAILMECMTYATAGMMTTREFIVACAWVLFERPEVKDRFLASSEAEQLNFLYEVLRMEPVAGMIHRRATEDWTGPNGEQVKAGELLAIDIRAANTDEKMTGECPFSYDETRAKRMKTPPMWMSFSEGPHRCPGNQVAIHETRVFLDRLFRLPGIRLVRKPSVGWCDQVQGYELHGAIVTCDP